VIEAGPKRSPSRLVLFLVAILLWRFCAAADAVQIEPNVAYDRDLTAPVTLDVLEPERANHAAILFFESGGWYSAWFDPKLMATFFQPLLDRGYTVFLLRHRSDVSTTIPEIVEGARRGVRFIRLHGRDYGVDPRRLGVLGQSSGGHIALMLATAGDDGDPRSRDEVLRQSSRVAAVVALSPPTDLRQWVTDPPPVIRDFPGLKPRLAIDREQAAACSPMLHATADDAPALLVHGTSDPLVPIEHSRKMAEAFRAAHVATELIELPNVTHDLPLWQKPAVVAAMIDWFEKFLLKARRP